MIRRWSDRETAWAVGRILVPISGLLGATVLITGALMHRATDGANALEASRSRERLELALSDRAAIAAHRLDRALGLVERGAGIDAPGVSTIARLIARADDVWIDTSDLDGFFIPPLSAPPIAALVAEVRRDAGSAADATALGEVAPRPGPSERHLLFGGGVGRAMLIVATARTVTTREGLGPAVALTAEFLDPRRLAALTGDLTLAGATLRGVPPEGGEAGLALAAASGGVETWLTWSPNRPGDVISLQGRREFVLAMIAIMLLTGLVFEYVRRATFDLASREAAAKRLAGHDPLSDLPNRKRFEERLDSELTRLARGGGAGLSVMFLDLDRFKEVNDSYGHQVGDALIRTVAGRLAGLLRGADTVARFGGDEFAVIQVGVRNPRDAEALARRILAEIRRPLVIDGAEIAPRASLGIALAPLNGTGRAELMQVADLALYRAKHEGRNRFAFFTEGMDEELRLRECVEHDLRRAIEADELEVAYQPVVASVGGRMVGVEALVRWNHPRFGSLSPTNFVALAEERGLIAPLGDWVLRRALRDARGWDGLRIAVNVSPVQFRHPEFLPAVRRIVQDSGVEPSRIELELTEGVVVEKADEAEEIMLELRALGLRLALDDFGTGYSSLIYLRRFAFDKIKIDRTFLETLEPSGESAVLVQSMVQLGQALGLTVCAEGVETEEQRVLIQATGCHQMQGFLFSKPVPAAEIDRLLADGQPLMIPLAA